MRNYAELIAAELGIAYFFAERFEPPQATDFPSALTAQPRHVRGMRIAIVADDTCAGTVIYADLRAYDAQPGSEGGAVRL